jgi:hypothetical protein
MEPNRLIDVINKATGRKMSLPACDEETALITVFILEEEGSQKHLPSWYRNKILAIRISKDETMLVLDNWTVRMRKKK